MGPTRTARAFHVISDGWKSLPSMGIPRSEGFIKDVYENPGGSRMCSGFFELKHAAEPLLYVYTYDEMKVVLEGEFLLENKDTGQTLMAKAKDAIFFPKGSRIYFSTPSYALAFYCGDRGADLL